MTGTGRCLLIAGGLHHPAEAAVPSIVAALGAQGIETDTDEESSVPVPDSLAAPTTCLS